MAAKIFVAVNSRSITAVTTELLFASQAPVCDRNRDDGSPGCSKFQPNGRASTTLLDSLLSIPSIMSHALASDYRYRLRGELGRVLLALEFGRRPLVGVRGLVGPDPIRVYLHVDSAGVQLHVHLTRLDLSPGDRLDLPEYL